MEKIDVGPKDSHYKITVKGYEPIIVKAANPISAFARFINLCGHTRSMSEYDNCGMMVFGVISSHTESITIEYFDIPVL